MAKASAASIRAQISSFSSLSQRDPGFSWAGKTPADVAAHFKVPVASARRAHAGFSKAIAPRTKLEQKIAQDVQANPPTPKQKKGKGSRTPPKQRNRWLEHVASVGLSRYGTGRQGAAGERFGFYHQGPVPNYQSLDFAEDGTPMGTSPTDPDQVREIARRLRGVAMQHPDAWAWFATRQGAMPTDEVSILLMFTVVTFTASTPPSITRKPVYYNTGFARMTSSWVREAQALADWMEQFLAPPPGSGSYAGMVNEYARTTHRHDHRVDAVAEEGKANKGAPLESTYWA